MNEWIAVVTITLLACISPGPDFALVSRNSLLLSRRTGVLTAAGIGLGIFVHVCYTLLGLGLVLQHSLWLFSALKMVGAAYLIYLGIKMLGAMPAVGQFAIPATASSDLAALRAGFLTNALNPKTSIFIVSLFIGVVGPETTLPMQIAYGVFISAAHISWFSLVAMFFSNGRIREELIAVRHWVDRAFGGLLVSFGVMLAIAQRSH
ncbi:LysE family transporter [Pseudomonas sp. R-28-1W-6]|uniref:LysE family translocator n=1 Tax=Pseudomonas sp. R-28-1W-6 TaxID=2650101 RepID=UPI0013662E12|nr:LysE family transporter [Pseudomonas sp. R-28-1W-6]MWV11391.1 LysE family transporter [Pseudomonas sp. R-28-1W-6]